ncbi:MAG: Rpn family recombination-promoting nuclease/putative transposase [Clostridiales bacterium]|jgi:predicted transposase/invertase (TIGR01784 family)|nr:Rpn family recombination-promoting nuclease/putative transposase [Clostridiales bacterium]
MEKSFLSPRNDLIFRLLFGDERCIEQLTDFLKSVLRIPHDDYGDLTIVDPFLLPEYKGGKLGILDVKLKTKSGKSINIEIQISPLPYMRERILFYISKMVSEQLGTSEEYENIKKVISIIITDYPLIDESPKYHHRFTLFDQENKVEFSDVIEVNTLEIAKLPRNEDGTPLWVWMKFLDARTEEELNMIAEKNPQVKKAVVRLMELSADERTRMLYEAREKERRDNYAREKGAIKEREYEFAKKLLKRNRPIAEIIEDTGLTHAEIEELIKVTDLAREEVEGLL